MGSRTKEEQHRVKTLLSDTVTLLCKNGLSFKKTLKVQGLLGITVDDDEVFIVHLNETMGDLVSASDVDRTPSKSSDSVPSTPRRKRRRRSTDSNSSRNKSPRPAEQQDNIIDLDPDIDIKREPDAIVLDEVKYEGNQRQSCAFGDEGLDLAIGSISSFEPNYSHSGETIGGQAARRGTGGGFHTFNTGASATDTVTTSTGQPPYITGIIPNVADTSNQSSGSGSLQWDSNTAQGQSGMSNWASQLTQQAMSQSDMSQQPGPSQGFPQGQRTGTAMSSRSTRSRHNMRENDPEKYSDYLAKQRQRGKQYRDAQKKELNKANPNEAMVKKTEERLEKNRQRQARYMAKKRQNDKPENSTNLPESKRSVPKKARTMCQSLQDYNRMMKQKQRTAMSPDKRMWERQQDRERKRRKRDINKSLVGSELCEEERGSTSGLNTAEFLIETFKVDSL